MGFKETSIVWKSVFCIQLPGLILALIGFGTNTIVVYNYLKNSYTVGLWKVCNNDDCYDTSDVLKYRQESTVWLEVSKAMMSICLIFQFLTILMTSLTIFKTLTRIIVWCTAAVSVASVVFGIVGSTVALAEMKRIFDDKVTYVPGYSFTLFMVSQAVFFVAAGLHIFDSVSRPQR